MTTKANPWQDAEQIANALDARRAPFYAVVVSVDDPLVYVTRVGESTSQECDASEQVIADAEPGDTVWCLPTGGRVFVAAIKAS